LTLVFKKILYVQEQTRFYLSNDILVFLAPETQEAVAQEAEFHAEVNTHIASPVSTPAPVPAAIPAPAPAPAPAPVVEEVKYVFAPFLLLLPSCYCPHSYSAVIAASNKA
jgi:hypothetical protein